MPCCLPCTVSVSKSEQSGRLVCSETLIEQGHVMFSNEATVQLLLKSLWGERCLNCFKANMKLSVCTNCKHASYCSRNCQRSDWKQHKVECKHVNQLWDKLDANLLNELFVLLRLSSVNNSIGVDCLLADARSSVRCGSTHIHDMHIGAIIDHNEDQYSHLLLKLAEQITGRSFQELTVWLRQFRSNNFGITDELLNCIGIGVFPAAALLNHSCAPNCILRYRLTNEGIFVDIVATQNISKGEELTHSYVDCSLPKTCRKKRLLEVYDFDCGCQLCGGVDTSGIESFKLCVDAILQKDPLLLDPIELRSALLAWKSNRIALGLNHLSLGVDYFLCQTLSSQVIIRVFSLFLSS
jgi:[histone H3]-lysine4/36 N-trimethyltransferase SMYD